MKTKPSISRSVIRLFGARFVGLLCAAVFSAANICLAAADAKTFATPEEAVAALAASASSTDRQSLRDLLGLEPDEIVATDQVQSSNELAAFTAAFNVTNHLVCDPATKCVLEVGTDDWPFPIPLAQKGGRWFFDTDAGKDELLNRRIGRNELSTLQSVRAYVAAQREYAGKDQDGDGILQYAKKIISSPGKKDGLYWSPDLDGTMSPLGPLVAQAQAQGYGGRKDNDEPQPYHGYFFKVLTQQGKHAPAGKYNYVINGHLLAGFALVAWPADYGESGVMTFIVNQQGKVYQKDLGPKTEAVAKAMTAYDPDSTWTLSKE